MQRNLKNVTLGGSLSLALLLSSCGGNGQENADGDETAVDGGDLVFALDTPVERLDPNVAGALQEARIIRSVFDSLVALDDEGNVVPWLAESWDISEDGLTYTFNLRDDVTFHDGTGFNAEAVCFNFDRIVDPETGSFAAIGLIGPYESCEVEDEFTAAVTLESAYAPFLNHLTASRAGMVSPAAVEEMDPADFSVQPVGTGPFVIDSYTQNDRVELVRNDDYDWAPASVRHSGPAHLDSITFQIIPDATVRIGSLRSDGADAIGVVPDTEIEAVQADETLNFISSDTPGATFQLFFNQENEALVDPDVRRALRAAIDIDTAVEALYFGAFERAWGPLSPVIPGYSESVEGAFEHDPQLAEELLDEAGWEMGDEGIRERDGERLTFRYIEQEPNREKRQDFAEFIRSDLAEIGVEIDFAFQVEGPLVEDRGNRNFDIATLSVSGLDPDVLSRLYSEEALPTPDSPNFNLSIVEDEELEDLLRRAGEEADQEARLDLYAEAQDLIIEQVYTVGLYVPSYTVATTADLTGIEFTSDGTPSFYEASFTE